MILTRSILIWKYKKQFSPKILVNIIKEIKNTIKSYTKFADIRLSGIPMIADDMIGF